MGAEVWKDVAGYEGLYQVSDMGRVKSMPHVVRRKSKWDEGLFIEHVSKECIMSPDVARGYERVRLFKGGKVKRFLVHRLVAEAFIPNNDKSKTIINHLDGNKRNNTVGNLEWCDNSRNVRHAYEMGLRRINEKHPCSKLKNDEVKEIRRLRQVERLTCKQLGEKYGVSVTNIKNIVNNKTWKGVNYE